MLSGAMIQSKRITTLLHLSNSSRFILSSSSFVHTRTELSSYPSKPLKKTSFIDFRRVHEVSDATDLFRRMLLMDPLPSVFQFTNLMGIVVKMKNPNAALYMFDEMRQRRITFNDYTLTIVINSCCLLNRLDLAFAVFSIFLQSGFSPTVVTFSTLIRGLLSQNRVAEAVGLFKKCLKKKLCEPNVIMINSVINGLCKSGHTRMAMDLLANQTCEPDVCGYSAIIDKLCKDRMVDDALSLFSKMVDKGISPNAVTYDTLIRGLCVAGRWKEAEDLIDEMVSHDIRPNVVTFTALIDAFCKKGEVEEAERVLEVMNRKSVAPNIITYNTFIHGLFEDGKFDSAMNLFHSLPSKGVKPDVWTFTIIIGALCQKGFLDEAKIMFMEMEERGCTPDSIAYSVFVKGCLQQNEFVKAKPLLEEMVRKGFPVEAAIYNKLRRYCEDEKSADPDLLNMSKALVRKDD